MSAGALLMRRAGLDALFALLQRRGYSVVAPTVQDEAIVYDQIDSPADLPEGWTDEQAPGHYRIRRRDDAALFGYNVGPHAWKRFLYPPEQRLWRMRRDADGAFAVEDDEKPTPRYALLGVRACELAAIAIQDRVFLGHDAPDPVYQARRGEALLIAANCGQAGGTCFCASMDAGPRARGGYDLALTELIDGERHEFFVEVGSESGAELMNELALEGLATPADEADEQDALSCSAAAERSMGRQLDTRDIRGLMQRNFDNEHWDQVAERCLSCGNCTLVCPTCFCSDVEDVSDLSGEIAERWRSWGSCFESDFSYIHGGAVRSSIASRYRQWLTHKLSTWYDQFGSSGCVGCGRCITWCPVGIDITEEAAAIRASEEGCHGDS